MVVVVFVVVIDVAVVVVTVAVIIVVVVVVVVSEIAPLETVVATGASDSAATSLSNMSTVARAALNFTLFDGAMYNTIRHMLPITRSFVTAKWFAM